MKEKSRWELYKEKNGVTPLDLLNPMSKKTENDVAEKRLEICKQCPELLSVTTQCKKCGCFMNAKVKLEAARCPLEKW